MTAALVRDGHIIAAAEEERFSRRKHDARLPQNALRYCLAEGGTGLSELNHVVFYHEPLVKFECLLETYLAYAPRGFHSFVSPMPIWLKEKFYLKHLLRSELAELLLLFTGRHQVHAASAFFTSPFPSWRCCALTVRESRGPAACGAAAAPSIMVHHAREQEHDQKHE